MVLKDIAFAIINGQVASTPSDVIEAFQFINDNGYCDELSMPQLLYLKDLVESGTIFSPACVVTIP